MYGEPCLSFFKTKVLQPETGWDRTLVLKKERQGCQLTHLFGIVCKPAVCERIFIVVAPVTVHSMYGIYMYLHMYIFVYLFIISIFIYI